MYFCVLLFTYSELDFCIISLFSCGKGDVYESFRKVKTGVKIIYLNLTS